MKENNDNSLKVIEPVQSFGEWMRSITDEIKSEVEKAAKERFLEVMKEKGINTKNCWCSIRENKVAYFFYMPCFRERYGSMSP